MKLPAAILAIVTIILLGACTQSDKKKTIVSNGNNVSKTTIDEEKPQNIDSIRLDSILQEAVKICAQNIHDETFKKEYIATMPDSSFQVHIRINSGFIFTKEHPHLIIRRYTPDLIYINIFAKTGNGFQQVLSQSESHLEYTGDTIRDINGDNLKDFVVNRYGSSGCCLKAFSNVYLLRSDNRSFSNNIEFINPTFSPEEHIIRGVCYGQPGETELYKYRWNNETVDTVEYISYEKNNKEQKTGKLIVSDHRPYGSNYKVLRQLNSVPAEYKKIEGYNWFTGKGY